MSQIKQVIALLRQTAKLFADRQGPLLAAGVAFYAFLSLFPALIAALSFYALFASGETVSHDTQNLVRLLPKDSAQIVTDQVLQITSSSRTSLGTGAVIATVLALYTASGATNSLLAAINVVQARTSRRNFLTKRAIAIAVTGGAIFVVAATFSLLTVVPIVQAHLGFSPALTAAVSGLRWVALVALVAISVAVLFRIARERADSTPSFSVLWRPSVGVATVGWLIASVGFSSYVNTFGRYSATYGALAGVAALMLWLWLGTVVVLFAATLEGRLRPAHT